MPWFKVDDQFWSHPKISELSNDAISLWVRAGSYSAQHLTDGFIPEAVVVRQLWSDPTAAGELVESGLWLDADGGFQFHDWLEYQPSASATLEKREAARERVRKAREKKRATEEERSQSVRANSSVTDSERSQNVRSTPNPNPNPNPSSKEEELPRKRGTRVPEDFTPTPELREWASTEAHLVDIDAKTREWIDYWSGVPGEKGVKRDWVATWRNGMRKQQQWAEQDQAKRRLTPAERAQQTLSIGRPALATDLVLGELE